MYKKSNKPQMLLIVGAFVAFGVGIYLYSNKVEVTAVCRDVRTYMDGTYSATIQKGGLQPRTLLTLYRLEHLRNKKVGVVEVRSEISKDAAAILYSGKDVSLRITLNGDNSKHAGKLELLNGKEKISAVVGCQSPTKGS